MSGIGSRLVILLCLAYGPAAWSQSIQDISPIDRRADDFYQAIAAGGRVMATWTVQPDTVPLGDDITLTLTVRGAANPHELVRPDLRTKPLFVDRFQIADGPPAPPGSFVYKLRPRVVGKIMIPELMYRYYQPRYADGKRMQTTYASSVPVMVTPPVELRSPSIPLDAPEEFFTISMQPTERFASPYLFWLPFTIAPAGVIAWLVIWNSWFTDSARRIAARRRVAFRRAEARLRAARRAPDPAGAAAATVRTYLATQHGISHTAVTPLEVAAELTVAGRDSGAIFDFLRACDSARFAPDRDTGLSLVDRAERLIAGDVS